MNYIKTINQFWRLRRSKRITSVQSDLYFFLLQESSSRGTGDNWENPFQCPNGLVCTSIGITEKTLIDARNVLRQLGLIEFESGITKLKSPTYYLLEYCNKVSNPGGNEGGNPVSNPGGNEGNIYKDKRNGNGKRIQTQQSSGADAPGEKTAHWKELVDAWFVFYKKKFLIDPTFKGPAAKSLQEIIKRLQELDEKSAQPHKWTTEFALRIFNHFLEKAFADEWLSKNFLLTNLWTKFDKIITNAKGTSTTQATAGQRFGSNTSADDYRGGFASGMG